MVGIKLSFFLTSVGVVDWCRLYKPCCVFRGHFKVFIFTKMIENDFMVALNNLFLNVTHQDVFGTNEKVQQPPNSQLALNVVFLYAATLRDLWYV